jgi:uncharacterized membrane protein YeiH
MVMLPATGSPVTVSWPPAQSALPSRARWPRPANGWTSSGWQSSASSPRSAAEPCATSSSQSRVSWLRHWWPIPLAAGTAVATIPITLRLGPDVDSRRTVLTADALGLAVFSVLGCLTAQKAGTHAGVAVIIGTISGITGGIIRDVLTGQPPAVFTGRFYALAAIAGTALYTLLIRTRINASLAWWISVAGVFALRTYALQRDWTIATIVPRKNPEAHKPREPST